MFSLFKNEFFRGKNQCVTVNTYTSFISYTRDVGKQVKKGDSIGPILAVDEEVSFLQKICM